MRPQGLPLRRCLLYAVRCPEGLCGTTGRIAAPAAPAFACERPYAFFAIDTRAPARRLRAAYGPGPNLFPDRARHGSSIRLRSARDGFSACCMPQGLSLLPTPPVRANCRPDLHLGRLPVLPACVLHALSGIVIPVGVRSPASWRTTASRCHATNTLAARPLTERDVHKIFLLGIKSKNKICCCEAM